MIEHKIREVPDTTCKDCSQLWEGECRAFSFPHNDDERMHRLANNSKMNCAEPREVITDISLEGSNG